MIVVMVDHPEIALKSYKNLRNRRVLTRKEPAPLIVPGGRKIA
jgi:hypothetical protein